MLSFLILLIFEADIQAQNSNPWPTNGPVGIGTTSPNTQLEVHAPSGSTQNNIAAFINPTTGSYATFTGAGSVSTVPSWANGSHILEFSSNIGAKSIISSYHTPLVFQTGNYRTDRMTIDLNGKVGINQIDPQERLHLENGNVFLPSSNGNSGALIGIQSSDYFNTNGVYMPHYGLKYASPTDGIGATFMASGFFGMRFFTGANERLRILQNGNVGIGSTEPGTALEVAGIITTKYPDANAVTH